MLAALALALIAFPSVGVHAQVGAGAGVPAVDRGAIWVPNTHDGTVSRVSVGGKVLATVKLGAGTASNGFLDSAVVAGGKVWVARDGAAEIDQIDPGADRVTKRIKVALRPGGLTTGGGYVWAFHFLGPQVTRIDQATGAKKVFTVDGLAGSGIAYAGGAVWAVSSGSTALFKLDPATGGVLARVDLPLPPVPKHGIIDAWWVAAGAGSLWVAEANYDRIVRVTGKVAKAIPVPVSAPFGVAFYRGAAWVAGSGKVARVDPTTNRPARAFTLAAGSAPVFTQVAAGPSGLWATDYDKGVLYRLTVS
jgi:hypothetical protein